VKLIVTAETGRTYAPFVRKHLRAAFNILRRNVTTRKRHRSGLPLREMNVVLVADARMSDLHVQFMNVPGPTDVLTFPIDENDRGDVLTGEVYVCVPEALRRARERKIQPKLEVLLYALHGLLHLLGYDDTTDRGFRTMHRTEDAILTELGFGPVFAASTAVKTTARRRSKRARAAAAKGARS
jgi:probable rRNA maturation factor